MRDELVVSVEHEAAITNGMPIASSHVAHAQEIPVTVTSEELYVCLGPSLTLHLHALRIRSDDERLNDVAMNLFTLESILRPK